MTEPAPRDRPVSVGDAYRFFVPLMLMAELMMISHAIIVSFLARMHDPEAILAAYSVAFYFHATLGSPVWACQIVCLSFIRDRASVRRLALFALQTLASIAWLWLAVTLTPLGDWFFGRVFGASPEVARSAKVCMLVALLIPPTTIVRSLAYGLMMVHRRTILVTYGTVLRLVGLAAIMWLLTRWFEGAVVGVFALWACIAIESIYALVVARRFYRALPERIEEPPGYRRLWRFSWPIMLMQAAESGVAFSVNFFLGRLARPELALAAFGVLDSIMRVLLSPLRNLVHTTQTLVRSRTDARGLLAFGTQVSGLFATVMLLFHLAPVRDWVLLDIMGLSAEIAGYAAHALRFSFLLALCMAVAGLTRGLLIASHNTGALAIASGLRIAAVAVVGAVALALGAENGALIGMLALVAAFGAEALLLGARLVQLDRRSPRLFEPPA